MIRAFLIVAIMPFLAACATIRTHQEACDRGGRSFPVMYDCMSRAVKSDRMIMQHSSSDLVHVYLQYGAALKERVQGGEVTDTDARLAYAILYSRLKDQSQQRSAASAARYGAFLQGLARYNGMSGGSQFTTTTFVSGGRPVVCSEIGNVVSCN